MKALLAISTALLVSAAQAQTPAQLPTGGIVQTGSATITTSGSTMTVTSTTTNTVINWQTFSIGTGQTTTFVQPSSSSVVLNRVVGTEPSTIFGTLNSNGQVFIVNNSGFAFGSGSQVNVAGLSLTSGSGDIVGTGSIGTALIGTLTSGGSGGGVGVISGGSSGSGAITVSTSVGGGLAGIRGGTPGYTNVSGTQAASGTGSATFNLEKREVAF
jgi:filamentous hemagglutinin family protein